MNQGTSDRTGDTHREPMRAGLIGPVQTATGCRPVVNMAFNRRVAAF
jgi:hypothetical protein